MLSLKSTRKESFIPLCRVVGADWRKLIDVDRSSKGDFLPIKYWNLAPYVPTLYGRDRLLLELKQKVSEERYRLIPVDGIEGILDTPPFIKRGSVKQVKGWMLNYCIE